MINILIISNCLKRAIYKKKQYKKDKLTKIDKNLIAEFSDAGSNSAPSEPETPNDFNPLNV